MAGQIPLDARYYPSDFQLSLFTIESGSTGTHFALIYADRDIIIDSISILIADAPGSDEAIKILKNTAVGTPTYAGTGTTTVVVAETALTAAGSYPMRYTTSEPTTGSTITGLSFVAGTNLLNKGSTLWLSGSSALGGIAAFQLQVRWRSLS